ncbi:5-dehydro-4-deoxy-D-glucuronate isomerase [Domibacillus enclensis]|uniref:4-deoxy-L-threo-5-hexosulose-uronate ketol-isomerase n=1 Tax=Domibacillus enclensis TaxID=1017273 RepID=A0A1N6Z801_9BACI|nr:5-dehydro-4-deoxy-D-glucuronate isomerase [Domibacillus enclensis]OXS76618.1 5-dehydro-4-deoxy-D-glucuronate isomerase [Domibacillus enclensis]SIR22899.1 4-deoxy-L-threo-5-hexulose uronate isomerase [Domibacillus enclensis]
MKTVYAHHPDDVKNYTTEKLREQFMMEKVFAGDSIELTYSHVDRIIYGGAMPVEKALTMDAGQELAAEYFLERREMGVINVGGDGKVTLDGKEYDINARDGLYIGKGTKDIVFSSNNPEKPAKFYINSCPAHHSYPTVKVGLDNAIARPLGADESMNKRTIYQFIHPDVLESCQLSMGMTMLEQGSGWNTMPCHTHERRMEVYFYFDMEEDTRVFHMMGQPQETRHILMANEQAVLSPSWSIHAGAGTNNYTFIWGMCGENIDFDDMQFVDMKDLR